MDIIYKLDVKLIDPDGKVVFSECHPITISVNVNVGPQPPNPYNTPLSFYKKASKSTTAGLKTQRLVIPTLADL